MLVLKRYVGDTIYLGADRQIAITVARVGRGVVRLAIVAPADVPIVRAELLAAADPDADTPTA